MWRRTHILFVSSEKCAVLTFELTIEFFVTNKMPGTDVNGPTDAMISTSMLESVVFQAIERKEMWHYQKNKKMYMPVVLHIGPGKSDYYFPVIALTSNFTQYNAF